MYVHHALYLCRNIYPLPWNMILHVYPRPTWYSKLQINYRYYFEIILCLKCSFFSWCRLPRICLELWTLGLLQACTYWSNSSRVQFAALFSFIFVPKLIYSHGFKRHLHADDSKIHIRHPNISPELQVLSTSLLVCLLGISKSEFLIRPPPPLYITYLFFFQWQHKKFSCFRIKTYMYSLIYLFLLKSTSKFLGNLHSKCF